MFHNLINLIFCTIEHALRLDPIAILTYSRLKQICFMLLNLIVIAFTQKEKKRFSTGERVMAVFFSKLYNIYMIMQALKLIFFKLGSNNIPFCITAWTSSVGNRIKYYLTPFLWCFPPDIWFSASQGVVMEKISFCLLYHRWQSKFPRKSKAHFQFLSSFIINQTCFGCLQYVNLLDFTFTL